MIYVLVTGHGRGERVPTAYYTSVEAARRAVDEWFGSAERMPGAQKSLSGMSAFDSLHSVRIYPVEEDMA